MPTYEYVCTACGHEFDAFQSIRAEPLKECPNCKGAVRRKIGSGGGIIFKGAGFYATDYRSKDYAKKAKSDAPAGGDGGLKSGSGGSAKPAGDAAKSGGSAKDA